MRRLFGDMNPTLRGFLIIGVIVGLVFALSLETTLVSLLVLARIAFFIAVAVFIFLVWRERRSDIALWPGRAQAVFYGAALLILVDLGAYFIRGASGLDALAFVLVLVFAALAMFRTWRDQERI